MNAILLTAEFKKIRHTPAIWISVVGPLIMALLIFLIFYFQGERLVKMDVNPYNKFISMGINSVIMILFPLFVVIINSLILSIEHSAQGWKMLLTAPVSRLNIYLSKWGLIQLLVFLTLLLYLFYLVVFVYVLSLLKPELNFSMHQLNLGYFALWFLKIFVAVLALSTIQYQLSLWLKNTFKTIGIGLLAVIAGLILIRMDFIDYYPYAYSALSFEIFPMNYPDTSLVKHEYWSLIYTAALLAGGWFLWKRKQFH
ncbi:MAG: ABC transporter permease [Bacteroidota bacterium]